MLNKIVIRRFLATAFLIASLPLVAQTNVPEAAPEAAPENVPALLVKANEAYLAKNYLGFREALQQLHKLRPNNSEYMYQLVIAHALLNEKPAAYDLMLSMQKQGLSYDFTKNDGTQSIRGTEVFEFVNDMMVMAGDPVGESEPAFTLPKNVVLPETMAWDESRQKFLIGTVADGVIHAVGKDGEVTELIKADKKNGMWSVFDILVDQARNRLWVSSAAIPIFSGFDPVDKGRSALFEYNLETLEMIRRYPVPVDGRPHVLGSMTLGPNGDIYIVDRALPFVYTKAVDEQKLRVLVVAKDMVSMRGIAMQPDGNIMYVADRELGILVVDLKGNRVGKLMAAPTLNLGGIDGLYLWNNHLVVIQNGIKPQRVMRLGLDASGTKVEAIRPLAVAQPAFDFPSFGTLQGEDLYYFASSKTTINPNKPEAVTVLRTPIDSSKDLVGPDMEAYMNERGKKMEEKYKAAREKAEQHAKPEDDKSGGS